MVGSCLSIMFWILPEAKNVHLSSYVIILYYMINNGLKTHK